MEATRQLLWNINGRLAMYGLLLIFLGVFAFGLYQRAQLWRIGKPEQRLDNLRQRLKALLTYGLGHKRLLSESGPGLTHLSIFSGFLILTIGTAVVALQADLHLPLLFGNFYLIFSLIMALGGAFSPCGGPPGSFQKIPQQTGGLRQHSRRWCDADLFSFHSIDRIYSRGLADVRHRRSLGHLVASWPDGNASNPKLKPNPSHGHNNPSILMVGASVVGLWFSRLSAPFQTAPCFNLTVKSGFTIF
jgi:hypothetical protein